jgi:uncharacterized protein
MIITVFGATGQVGLQVIEQALAKNYTVKAFGRNIETLIDKDLRTENFVAIKGYVFDEDEVYNAIKGSNAVISCLGGGYDINDKTRSLGMKNILKQIQKTNIKKMVGIGAYGILNNEDNTLILEREEYPEEYKPVSLEHLAALHLLENSLLDWTFICPPNIINEKCNGNYTTAETYLPQPNNWQISSGNLAHCILKTIEQNIFVKQKVGISNL